MLMLDLKINFYNAVFSESKMTSGSAHIMNGDQLISCQISNMHQTQNNIYLMTGPRLMFSYIFSFNTRFSVMTLSQMIQQSNSI